MKHITPTLFLFAILFFSANFYANYMLIQNVTTVNDNPSNKTIQVQFDISWQNSWRDAINWDAAWLFVKYKDGAGNWGHAYLNTTGYNNGTGTSNTLEVTNDNVGAFLYRSGLGSGSFTSTGMQLQWNYGLNGLNSVTGLELKVFGIEQVYIPEGEFNINYITMGNPSENLSSHYSNERVIKLSAPGDNNPVINNRLSPSLNYYDRHLGLYDTIRIKGDVGIDTDNDGVVDNTTYPTGFEDFYLFKYELTEQQYSDFYNTLTSTQQSTIGLAGSFISLVNGKYVSSTPNNPCIAAGGSDTRLFSYADWSGLRPMTFLEFHKSIWGNEYINPNSEGVKASNDVQYWNSPYYGNNLPVLNGEETYADLFGNQTSPYFYSDWETPNYGFPRSGIMANSTSTRESSYSSYYGVMDYSGNLSEPFVKMNYYSYDNTNGDGILSNNGESNISIWLSQNNIIHHGEFLAIWALSNYFGGNTSDPKGIRLCRSAP